MTTQPTMQTKLAGWISAFNSIPNKQSEEALILKGLVDDLENKVVRRGKFIVPGVA